MGGLLLSRQAVMGSSSITRSRFVPASPWPGNWVESVLASVRGAFFASAVGLPSGLLASPVAGRFLWFSSSQVLLNQPLR